MLRLAPEYDHDLYFDENPDHPMYHPPPGGGMAAIRRMDHDRNMWALSKWVHTQATRLHERASTIKLGIAGFLWLLELLQLSYFPLRAAFPKTMSLWKSISEGLATLNVSSMSGKDSFLPAFVTCIILAGIAFLIATTQVGRWLQAGCCPAAEEVWVLGGHLPLPPPENKTQCHRPVPPPAAMLPPLSDPAVALQTSPPGLG